MKAHVESVDRFDTELASSRHRGFSRRTGVRLRLAGSAPSQQAPVVLGGRVSRFPWQTDPTVFLLLHALVKKTGFPAAWTGCGGPVGSGGQRRRVAGQGWPGGARGLALGHPCGRGVQRALGFRLGLAGPEPRGTACWSQLGVCPSPQEQDESSRRSLLCEPCSLTSAGASETR